MGKTINEDSASKTRRYIVGRRYKLYMGGDIYDLETGKFKDCIADHAILDYIFKNNWQKNQLDQMIGNQPKSFIDAMELDRAENAKLLSEKLKETGILADPELHRDFPGLVDDLHISDLFNKPLDVRLHFISKTAALSSRSVDYKNLVDRTFSEALLILLKVYDKK